MADRNQIGEALQKLNEAENSSMLSPEEKVDIIHGGIFSEDTKGWVNGEAVESGTEEDRGAADLQLFADFPDYHRLFERIMIDPPFASVGWTVTLTHEGNRIETVGQTQYEFGDDGKIIKLWLAFNQVQENS